MVHRKKKKTGVYMTAILAFAPTQAAEFEPGETPSTKPAKGLLTRFFKKAADIASRAAVTNAVKIAALSAFAGAGLSSVATLGVAAIAAGAGAALYSYGRDTFTDWQQARASGGKIDWRNPAKLKRAKIALLTGVAGGAFGAWLAGTEFFQTGIEAAKEFGAKTFDLLIPSAAAAGLPAAVMTTAQDILPATATDPAQKPNVLTRLWQTAMKSDQAQGKFAAYLLKADPNNMNSVSPQFLKDRAHDVLRLKDIPMQERLSLAHDLAETAKERGNKQAVQFLKDLVKLGYTPPVELAVAQAALPDAEILPAPRVAEIAIAPAQAFREAATCVVAVADVGANSGDYGIECVTNAAVMKPGDYVSFVDKLQPALKVSTPLLPGSEEVPTESFLHDSVMSDGVARLNALRPALSKPALAI